MTEIYEALRDFESDLMTACHDLAGAGAMRRADESKAALIAAITRREAAVRKSARVLLTTIRGYECESFGYDVLEAAIMDMERALSLDPAPSPAPQSRACLACWGLGHYGPEACGRCGGTGLAASRGDK